MSKKPHNTSRWVWRFFVTLAVGCAEPYTPVSEGVSGWCSDRALEIDATLQAEATVPCGVLTADAWVEEDFRVRAGALAREGAPLFLERARLRMEKEPVKREGDVCRQPYSAHVESYASHEEIAERGGRLDAYRAGPFRHGDGGALRERPDYDAFAADGLLTVGAVFGQMDKDELSAADEGYWSLAAFEAYWRSQGLDCRWRFGLPGRCQGVVGDLRIRAHYLGPELFGVRGISAKKELRLRQLIEGSEVLYINGHAFQSGLGPLSDAQAYPSGEARLVVLDLCWASLWMLPDMRQALSGRRVDVIATPRRVVTGSAGALGVLLDVLVSGASDGAAPAWGPVLGAMNDAAEERAEARREEVNATLREPEVYGVARLW